MAMPNWIVRPEDIKNVTGNAFEAFCHQLLTREVTARHVNGRVDGPPAEYHPDGGMDLAVTIKQAPKTGKSEFPGALTTDDIGVNCVSCKSGDLRKLVMRDAKNARAPIDVLSEGGSYTIIINEQRGKSWKDRLIRDVRKELESRLAAIGADLNPNRIELIDASDLAHLVANHPIHFDEVTQQLLRIRRLPGVLTFEQWQIELSEERDNPEFVPDEARGQYIDQIRDAVTAERRDRNEVIWVFGPPGVGKSRLVQEALKTGEITARQIFCTTSYEDGRGAIYDLDIPAYNDIVMVADECPSPEAGAFASRFQARGSGSSSTLIVIGPQLDPSDSGSFPGRQIRVDPLKPTAMRRLVESQLAIGPGGEAELVGRVLNLAEGFPWYAILLARAANLDRDALPIGADQWRAAKVAMAGPPNRYSDDSSWDSEALARARTLLSVILTEGIHWSQLDDDTKNELGKAVGTDWQAIPVCAESCHQRGLIRVRQNWRYKYVTPNNLARVVVSKLLEPPFSLGVSIREHAPQLVEDLVRRLRPLEVPDSLLDTLAAQELEYLRNQPDPFDPGYQATPGTNLLGTLQFVAEHQPGRTAEWLRVLVESKSIDRLKDDSTVRRHLVSALAHITHRVNGFEDAEAALFRLALAENESWGNNATGVWKNIFSAALSLTHRDFNSRLAILEEHCKNDEADSRLLCIVGLEVATGWESTGGGFTDRDRLDGEWPRPTMVQVHAGKLQAWQSLSVLANDTSVEVAHASRGAMARNLRATVRWQIMEEVFSMLEESIRVWDESERAELREQMNWLGNDLRQHREAGRDVVQLLPAYERFRGLVEPQSYHGKLLDVVGRWMPGRRAVDVENFREYEAELDRELAAEGLASPAPLIHELEWLDSDEAVRVVSFMYEVGKVDTNRTILRPLIERAKMGGALNALPRYLAGVAESGAVDEVESLLRSWREDSSLARHSFMTITRLGLSDERIAWIIEDLNDGAIEPDFVGPLALGSWGSGASTESLSKLVGTLAGFDSRTAKITALDLISDKSLDEPAMAMMEDTLTRLVADLAATELPGMSEYTWELSAKLALRRGRVSEVIESTTSALKQGDGFGSHQGQWNILLEAMEITPLEVWDKLAPETDTLDTATYRLMLEAQDRNLLSRIPLSAVLDWVGTDNRRALFAAVMASAHEAPLNELARQLIIRFGPKSDAAGELAARAGSTPGAIWGEISQFSKDQLDHAKVWAQDEAPEVSEWGREMVRRFQSMLDAELAREEYEERQRG